MCGPRGCPGASPPPPEFFLRPGQYVNVSFSVSSFCGVKEEGRRRGELVFWPWVALLILASHVTLAALLGSRESVSETSSQNTREANRMALDLADARRI